MKTVITCAAIGEGNLLLTCLKELIQRDVHVNAVFTNTDSVETFCIERGVPVYKRSADLVDILNKYETDYLFSISNPRILKEDVLKLPRTLTINYHDSPLPAYAGVHATSWAIMRGEKFHGISWHVVEVGIDTGDILQSETVEILDDDSALTLNLKCVEASKKAFCRLADDIVSRNITRVKQPENGRTYFGLYAIPPSLGLLKFTEEIDTVYNLARALEFGHHENSLGSPKLKTSTGEVFLITNVEKSKSESYSADNTQGKILDIIDDTLIVATASTPIEVSIAHLHGTSLPISSYRNHGLLVGNSLECRFDIHENDVVSIRKRETFWRRKMAPYEPTMFYRQKMNVVASIIDVADEVSIKSVVIDLPQAKLCNGCVTDISMHLQSCFVAFLARINCISSVNVGILVDKTEIPNDARDLYSDITPGIFTIDSDANLEDVFDKCFADLKQHKDANTFLLDMFYRYPELRGSKRAPHHNIVMSGPRESSMGDKQLQAILRECNVLLFFGEKNGTKLEVMCHERPAQDFSHVTDVLQHFSTFLEAVNTSKESMQLKYVSMISENDKNQYYRVPVTDEHEHVNEKDISRLVDRQCKLTPLSIALKTTKDMMTYNRLATEINNLQKKLESSVFTQEICQRKQVIALHMPNSVPYVVSLLAIAKGNMAFLPLPTDLPADRLCFTLKDAKVGRIMMTKVFFEKCDFNGLTVCMRVLFEHQLQDDTIVLVEFGTKGQYDLETTDLENNCLVYADKKFEADKITDSDFLYVMYTSGSTGRPKGVKVKESSVINLARAQITCWDIVPGDVIAQFASIGFDATISEIFTTLLSGASLALLEPGERLGSDFVTVMSKMKVSTITLPPSALNIYSPDDLPTLRKVISAGEACTLNTAVKWTSVDVRFFNAYGPTEGTVCATCYEYKSGTMYEDVNRDLPIGKGIDGVQVYLFDDFMSPVPPDVVGEIYIGGKGLAHGYIGHARSFTNERFVQNPLMETPSLLYKTGDHAFQDRNGNITYIGRTDDQVKIRGHRIDLSEIEQVLIQHPKIDMAVVVVHKCSTTNDLAVAAYVAPTFIYISELREYIAKVLPKYMIPTYIKKLEVKDFPTSVSGKINRKKLERDESIHQQIVAHGHSHLNDMQLMVARQWCKVFNFEESFVYSLHRRSSFSELGGNSLQLVLLMRLLEDTMTINISFTDLGTADTIEEFADVIRRRRDIKTKHERNDLKSRAELREMIFHDSEIDDSFFPNPEKRRSIEFVNYSTLIQNSRSRKSHPKNILLSGVTGFLGAFLLSEILEQSNAHVCCMVRESSEARGVGRIIDNMRKYGLWKFEYSSRIAVVLSDLSQENLGIAPDIYRSMCKAIDVVFMNAAMMNFNTPYEDHRIANVLGTKEFIKFAATGVRKHIFATSSLSVFLFPPNTIENGNDRKVMVESDFFDDPLLIEGGYGKSKWASERLVMQALDFLPGGAIFRPARVSGRSKDGVSPKNDLFASTLIGMKKLGSYPDMDYPYDLTPVDFCARAMIEVTLKMCGAEHSNKLPKVYHLFNKDTIPFRDLFKGMDLKPLPLDEWRKELRKADMTNKELLPLTPFFMSGFWDRAPDWPIFDTSNIDNVISDSTKLLLKPSKDLLPVYKQFFGV